MSQNSPQVPWTDEQWTRATKAVLDEAQRARVAGKFLPLFGPLPGSADFVRAEGMTYGDAGKPGQRMRIDDTRVIQLATLQVKVYVRGAQMADPEMTSALQLFRRAANVLARLEDAVVFNGQRGPGEGPAAGLDGLPGIWDVLGGQAGAGLFGEAGQQLGLTDEGGLVRTVSEAIGMIEGQGHFGPFAVVLGQELFSLAQTPNKDSLVLPQDRILPFLGGGPLLRSSSLPAASGLVVALGAAPVELVVATDMSLMFLQLTTDPQFVFRVHEKIALRIREASAILAINPA